MGYCISQRDCKFVIKAANKSAALKAARALAPVGESRGGGGNRTERWFMWMNGRDLRAATSLEQMLEWWRYAPTFAKNRPKEFTAPVIDADVDIIGVDFQGEKIGEEKFLWNALAPFIEPGSYIEMQGEDGERWRWTFDGKTCTEIQAKVTW
jgi:hypothetical protein